MPLVAGGLPNIFGFDDPNILDIFQYSFGDPNSWMGTTGEEVSTVPEQHSSAAFTSNEFSNWHV